MTAASPTPDSQPSLAALLPHRGPDGAAERLLLFAIRRMALGGLDDAYAAHAMFTTFGRGFRRPLVLLRATMAEVSRVSAPALMIAPCCCPRITADERGLMTAIAEARVRPAAAHDRLAGLLRLHHSPAAAETARALSDAFADLGHPLATSG